MSLLFRTGYFRVGLLNTSSEIKHNLHLFFFPSFSPLNSDSEGYKTARVYRLITRTSAPTVSCVLDCWILLVS